MAKLSDRGMAIKLRLMERGETQKDLIEKVRKTDPSFDSKTLYDLMYRDRVSKYTPVVLSLLGIESEERAAENVGPCTDGKTASAGMNPTTADAVPLPLTREALAGASPRPTISVKRRELIAQEEKQEKIQQLG